MERINHKAACFSLLRRVLQVTERASRVRGQRLRCRGSKMFVVFPLWLHLPCCGSRRYNGGRLELPRSLHAGCRWNPTLLRSSRAEHCKTQTIKTCRGTFDLSACGRRSRDTPPELFGLLFSSYALHTLSVLELPGVTILPQLDSTELAGLRWCSNGRADCGALSLAHP